MFDHGDQFKNIHKCSNSVENKITLSLSISFVLTQRSSYVCVGWTKQKSAFLYRVFKHLMYVLCRFNPGTVSKSMLQTKQCQLSMRVLTPLSYHWKKNQTHSSMSVYYVVYIHSYVCVVTFAYVCVSNPCAPLYTCTFLKANKTHPKSKTMIPSVSTLWR